MNVRDLETEVLKLDIKSRAELARKLLNSLDALSNDEISQLWIEEAQRREAQMDQDPESGIPAEDVFRESYAALR